MLSKTIVLALLATAAIALPAMTARDSSQAPNYILDLESIDEDHRPFAAQKRDPNTLVKFYIPGAPAPDDEAEATADLDKRFYIYHRPPPGAESLEKRDPNSLVKFYIPEAPEAVEKRDPNSLVKFYIPEAPEAVEKRDPNSLVKFYIPEAPAEK